MEFTGDGVMAIFGAPLALGDHAFRACLASLDIQQEAKRWAAEVQRRDGVVLLLRVGLNSGAVITGEIGSESLGYGAIGRQVGFAQRMESVAPRGGVMLFGVSGKIRKDLKRTKAERDAKETKGYAEMAEGYALDAIDFAEAAVREAEYAVLVTLSARAAADAMAP